MIKEIFLAILLVIISLTNVYTGDVFTPEVKENPAPMFADGLTERDIATTYPYIYEDMMLDIAYLEMKYPDIIEVDTIGTSEWGYPTWTMVLGKGEKAVLINTAHHAREYPTVSLTMKMINNKTIPEEEMLEAWEKNRMVGLWLADMVRKENIQ